MASAPSSSAYFTISSWTVPLLSALAGLDLEAAGVRLERAHSDDDDRDVGDEVAHPDERARGVEPVAVRAAILAHHYRSDWEWSEDVLARAQERVARWRAALEGPHAQAGSAVLDAVHAALSDDLDAPRALEALEEDGADRLFDEIYAEPHQELERQRREHALYLQQFDDEEAGA